MSKRTVTPADCKRTVTGDWRQNCYLSKSSKKRPEAKPAISSGVLRVKTYDVLVDAVHSGVAYGWTRAHKHEDEPDGETICEHMEREVLNAICEKFFIDEQEQQ